MKTIEAYLFCFGLAGLMAWLLLLAGCKSVTPTAAPAQTVNALPSLPAPQALTSDAQSRQAEILAHATNRPALTNIVLAWDTYTNPDAAWLAVQGEDTLAGPWTNFAVFIPAISTNQSLIPIDRVMQFFRVTVGIN